jgi:hypothetical protein
MARVLQGHILALAILLRPLATPVFDKACCLDPDKLKITKAEFRSLEAANIVCHSNSSWLSRLHLVPKLDGTCGNYRCLTA